MSQPRGHEIVFTEEARSWLKGLPERERAVVTNAIDQLAARGRKLGQPLVKPINHARHPEMQELRPPVRNIRVLFAVDRQNRAVMLVGGDKTNDWKGWYDRNIEAADRLFDLHLQNMRGGERWQLNRTGSRSEPRSR